MAFAIETKALTRSYITHRKPEGLGRSLKALWKRDYQEKLALQPLDTQIESGQILGIVGGNGAGKTTLLKLLSGIIQPTSGSAEVLGFTPWKRQYGYLRQMSILLGQKSQLWWDLTALDNFKLLASIYDLDTKSARNRALMLAELLNCQNQLRVQLRRLSLGERMKMEIIGSLLHEPQMLFLDEPTLGLDILAQNSIRDFLSLYVREKKPTIILTSHCMDDIAKLSDRLFLMSAGRLAYDGSVDGLVTQAQPSRQLDFSVKNPLRGALRVGRVELEAGKIEFSLKVSEHELEETLRAVMAATPIRNLKINEAEFEDVIHEFLKTESRLLTGSTAHAT